MFVPNANSGPAAVGYRAKERRSAGGKRTFLKECCVGPAEVVPGI